MMREEEDNERMEGEEEEVVRVERKTKRKGQGGEEVIDQEGERKRSYRRVVQRKAEQLGEKEGRRGGSEYEGACWWLPP